MIYDLNETNAMSVIIESENYYDILKTLILKYAERDILNSAQLAKLISDIAEKAIEKSNNDKTKANGMLYMLTCLTRNGIDSIDDGLFPFLLSIMNYRHPDAEIEGASQAEKELFYKFLEMCEKKSIKKQFLNDEKWLKQEGFKEYVDLVKDKYDI